MNIYLDIETIPGPTPPEAASIEAPANYKDPEKIRAYQEAAVMGEWRKQALHPLRGRLWLLGFAVDDGPVQVLDSEDRDGVDSLHLLQEVVAGAEPSPLTWIGHNVAEFDLPWLQVRAIKYGLADLARHINLDRYRGNYFDTMQRLGGYRDKWSLNDAAGFFRVGTKVGSGADVFEMWRDGLADEAAAYCRHDVELVRRLHHAIERFV